MEGMKDEKYEASEDGDTQNGVVFIDLPFIITMLLDLSGLNSRPVHLRAVLQCCGRVWAPCTEDGIRLRSSIKAQSKGKETPLERKWEAFVCMECSRMTFMPAKNKMIDTVQPAKISRSCLCQPLGDQSANDLLYIPL